MNPQAGQTLVIDPEQQNRAAGLIMRARQPLNLEFPFDRLDGFLTPTELFYVRCHFAVPKLKAESHRLSIAGAVEQPFELTFDDLRGMKSETITATLECAGNSRIFLVPPHEGVQWELGAVSTGEWTGVRLSAILDRAGLKPGVREIVLEGGDRGEPEQKPKPPEPVSFARSIPIDKALQPEVLIAFRMNGQELTPEHGFPLRAIVPGYFAMASVKWLTRICAVDEPFTGYWQTSDYAYWDEVDGKPVQRGLFELKLKSEIARPAMYEVIKSRSSYTVFGAAWSGAIDVEELEVSTDEGETWRRAEFLDPIRPFAWRRWQYEWKTPSRPGTYVLLSRARDRHGNMQPQDPEPKYGGYVIHHTLPIEVFVK